MSLKENIVELFLNSSGRLFEEPSNLLKQELRDPFTYNAIITAIACGSSKLNEISTKVGIETSACSNHLTSLIALGLVKKEIPITESLSRKTIYLLEDQMRVDKLPFLIGNIGRWSGNNPKLKRQEEIDILTFHHENALFGECKWTNALVDIHVLNDLLAQSKLFNFKNNHFYLFAKSGFTEQCIKTANENNNIRLFTFDELNKKI